MTFNRDAWEGKKPLMDSRFGVRAIGTLALLEVGCECWTDVNARRNEHEDPLGGIVVDIGDQVRAYGELVRAFTCYDYLAPIRRAIRTFSEDEIEVESCEAGNPARLANAVRRFAGEIAKGHGVFTTGEADFTRHAARLAGVLMGGTW